MTELKQRVDAIAKDLYEATGVFVTINQLRKFLGCSRSSAEQVVKPLTPYSQARAYKRYYYRDIAEVLATGGQ